jgi:hypothetical protein
MHQTLGAQSFMAHLKYRRAIGLLLSSFVGVAACAQGDDPGQDERKRVALDEQLSALSKDARCLYYGKFVRGEELRILPSYSKRDEVLKKAFSRLDVSPDREWRVRMSSLPVGMTKCELIATKGFAEHINETVSGNSRSEQHVYGPLGPFVYTTNGRVTGWQDQK